MRQGIQRRKEKTNGYRKITKRVKIFANKKEAKEKVQSHLKVLLKSLEEKGVQISENHVKINIQKNICTASGTLLAVEKAGKKAPTDILPQQTERNFDINE